MELSDKEWIVKVNPNPHWLPLGRYKNLGLEFECATCGAPALWRDTDTDTDYCVDCMLKEKETK